MRILSGMQPTGIGLTLGNYIGALKPWVDNQHHATNFFCIVDLHAITMPHEPDILRASTLELAASYIAAGIDPTKSVMFIQSHVPAHAELGWLLMTQTPMGWLKRMTQFKDKSGKNQESIGTGLFTYPALMAADILLYHTTHVPVGDDQKQHVEMTRDLAQSFNQKYGEVFTLPQPMISTIGARVMSLRDGTKKMSKSDPSDQSRINLGDSADVIADKIKRAKTDTGVIPDSVDGFEGRAEVQNLVEIMAALTNQTPQQILDAHAGAGFAAFKSALADVVVAAVVPIGDKMRDLLNDRAALQAILASGRDRAAAVANPTLARTMEAMGFVGR